MFVKSLFLRSLVLCCYASSLLSTHFEESETKTKRGKRSIYRDYNHPGNLVHLHSIQLYFCSMDEDVKKKVPQCKTIATSLVPLDSQTHRTVFYHNYREWWAIFKYSDSEVIKNLKLEIENLTKLVTNEEKAALISRLNNELNIISENRTIYERKVVVNESDIESVVSALRVWGMQDEKLLNAVRAVHNVWDEHYSKDNVVWPRKEENSTRSA